MINGFRPLDESGDKAGGDQMLHWHDQKIASLDKELIDHGCDPQEMVNKVTRTLSFMKREGGDVFFECKGDSFMERLIVEYEEQLEIQNLKEASFELRKTVCLQMYAQETDPERKNSIQKLVSFLEKTHENSF
ncbi:hypothetical protein COB57_03290 [Candidatus Peregrinibacteria bacterium]|nr:MAG: hypothetical protein COB57_03290 [Candidatus Peregrinibacteria bacterium]